MSIELKAGDELVLFRRRTTTTKDGDGQDIVNTDMKEISSVRCPDEGRTIVGGSVEDKWVDNRRYIEILLETRR